MCSRQFIAQLVTAETQTCGAAEENDSTSAGEVNTADNTVAGVQSSVTMAGTEATKPINSVRVMPPKSVKVIIDEKPRDALIDSGSQVVLLNK